MDVSQTPPSFKILMFPWLAHGHIFPFLELSKRLLSRKNFHIYLCSTPVNFPSIKNFIQTHNLEDSIEPVELHLEPSCQLPPHYHTTKNLPSHLNFTLIKAFQTAKSSFSYIITHLNPDLVIYDIFQPWVPGVASPLGIPAVLFAPFGGATVSHWHQFNAGDDDFPFQELGLKGYEIKSTEMVLKFFHTVLLENGDGSFLSSFELSSKFILLKSTSGIEGRYIDYACRAFSKKLLPVGPLVTAVDDGENKEILQWLSKKAHHSTVYVSFGSEYFLSKEEIEEIAKGLELCEVNFIWVIRFPLEENTMTLQEALPKGFVDRVEDNGLVVTGWAPQSKILGHPSIGAFVSHCGWSSVMESMYFGVPIIGMPIKLNMFVDANMLVKAGACVRIPIKENEVYKGEAIAESIGKVIMGGFGDGLRCRARKLSETMRGEEGQELDVVADQLFQLCFNNNLK